MTVDTNELRRKVNSTDIVDHIDLHANIKPFLSEMIDRLEAAEKERDDVAQQLVQSEQGKRKISKECESYKAAYNDWADKTEWVQQGFNEGTISAKYLGMHRADVMARLLDEAEKERDALRAKIEQMEKRLRLILEEPENTMSNSKALREMVRQARLALEESK